MQPEELRLGVANGSGSNRTTPGPRELEVTLTEEGKTVSRPLRKATLPVGFVLHDTYVVKDILGTGGFGVTYLAEHRRLNKLVAIKEYWPDDFATRDGNTIHPREERRPDYAWGQQRFIEEAQTLARFRHQNIVGVTEFFEAHGTAYMVLDYELGRSLRTWLDGLTSPPTQDEVDLLVGPMLDALELLHNNKVLHRDIAPDNIYIRDNGTPVLLDFGSAREAISQRSRSVSAIVKAGYSPQEQYTLSGSNQGPWTDIYALAATIYEMITGAHPLDAPDRIMDDKYVAAADGAKMPYRGGFLASIDWALRLMPRDRPQSVKEWRAAFFAEDPVIPEPKTAGLAATTVISRGGTRVISQAGKAPAAAVTAAPNPAAAYQSEVSTIPTPPKRLPMPLILSMALLVPALGASVWGIKTFMKPAEPTVATTDPAKTEPSKTEPPKSEAPKAEAPKTEPVKVDPQPDAKHPPATDTKPEKTEIVPQPKPEPPATSGVSMASLTLTERLRIARALYEIKAAEDPVIDGAFVEKGAVHDRMRNSFERFQKLRSYNVTGELTQDQVTYLVNMQSGPTPWEAEQEIPVVKDRGGALWQRLRLTLMPEKRGSVSTDEVREALKSYQSRKGFQPTGYLSKEQLGPLLDEAVGYPWAENKVTSTFGKWKFFEDNERCKIWSETTHVGGRYLGSVAPVVEFYRNKASKGASLGFLLGVSEFYDINQPVKLLAPGVGTVPLQFDKKAIKPAKSGETSVSGDATAAIDQAKTFKIVGTSVAGKDLSVEYSSDGYRDAMKQMAERCGPEIVSWLGRAGAVARHEASFYGVWNKASVEQAREEAKKNCEAKHTDGKCSLTTLSGSQCWAMSRDVPDKGNWGYAIGDTIEAARELSLMRCKEAAAKCKVSFTFCADGSNMFNDK